MAGDGGSITAGECEKLPRAVQNLKNSLNGGVV